MQSRLSKWCLEDLHASIYLVLENGQGGRVLGSLFELKRVGGLFWFVTLPLCWTKLECSTISIILDKEPNTPLSEQEHVQGNSRHFQGNNSCLHNHVGGL